MVDVAKKKSMGHARLSARRRLTFAFWASVLAANMGAGACSHGTGQAVPDAAETPFDGGVPSIDDLADSGSADNSGRVEGFVVVETYGVGLGGYTVVVGGQSTITREDGSFAVEGVAEKYDAYVVGPRADAIRIYMGLTRRDPVFAVVAEDSSWFDSTTKATIMGTLSGTYAFPLEWPKTIDVYFLAGPVLVTEGLSQIRNPGPTFGPLPIAWQDSGAIAGQLVALGREESGRQWVGTGVLARNPLQLAQGDAVSADLTLASVPNTRLSGFVQMYAGGLGVGRVAIRYLNLGGIGGIQLDEHQGGGGQTPDRFDREVPDLSVLGGHYCVDVSDGAGNANVMKCGLSAGATDIGMVVQAPPEFRKPAPGSPVSKDSTLAWSAVSEGIFRLSLSPVRAPATRERPAIILYLTATETRWPDLGAVGLAFLPRVTYECQLAAFSPYDSLDAAVSLKGLGGAAGDGQNLRAQSMEVTTVQ